MVRRLRLKARYIKTVGITFKTNSITFKPDGITFETSNSIVSMKFSSEFWCSKPKLCESGHWHSCQIPEFREWMKIFLSLRTLMSCRTQCDVLFPQLEWRTTGLVKNTDIVSEDGDSAFTILTLTLQKFEVGDIFFNVSTCHSQWSPSRNLSLTCYRPKAFLFRDWSGNSCGWGGVCVWVKGVRDHLEMLTANIENTGKQ